jgi:hypothetical protein
MERDRCRRSCFSVVCSPQHSVQVLPSDEQTRVPRIHFASSGKLLPMGFLRSLLAPNRIPLEEQLNMLAQCGIQLKPEFSVETLLESFAREKYETSRYIGTLIRMGGELEREPFTPLSNNIWHFDAECIEDEGDYVRIAERMRDLAQGELPIENIRDRVDVENGDAWLEFDLRGETVHWGARVKEDWIDPDILSNFCALLQHQNGTRRFTYFDLKGQDSLIGCATEEELRKLRKATGLKFSWLA